MIKLVGETREVNSPLNSQRLVSDEWLTGSSVWRYPFPLMVDMGSNRISLDRTSLRFDQYVIKKVHLIEGSLEVKLPTIWTDEKQSRAEAERRGRLEERRSEEKE